MKYFFLVIILLIITFILNLVIFAERRIVKILTNTFIFFNAFYILISSVLLWLDYFSIKNALFIYGASTLIILLVIFIGNHDVKNLIGKIDFDISREIIVLFILILLLPIVAIKSEDIRSNSDMGIYFERTAVLMSENTKHIREIEEYNTDSAKIQEGINDLQKEHLGLYSKDDSSIFEYHSSPTWVTLMALFGKMFGIYNANQVLTYIYILAILSLYFSIENMAVYKLNKFYAVLLFGCSPVIVYLTKSTYTELSFIFLLFSFMFWITEQDNVQRILSSVLIGLLGFIHVSMFIYFPIFTVSLLLISLYKKDWRMGIVNLIQMLLFLVSLFYMYYVSEIYTAEQLSRISKNMSTLGIIFIFIVIGMCFIILQVTAIVIMKRYKYLLARLVKGLNFLMNVMIKLSIILVLIFIIIEGYWLGFTEKYIEGSGSWHLRTEYANKGWSSIIHLNIISILMICSYICLPILFWILLKKGKVINYIYKVIALCLLYSILVFTVVQIDTPSNYYVSRYYSIVLLPLCIYMITYISKSKKMFISICLVVISTSLPFDLVQASSGAFKGQYNILQDVQCIIPNESIVWMNSGKSNMNLNVILTNNLREINDISVYNYSNIEEMIYLETNNTPMFIISEYELDEFKDYVKLKKEYSLYGNTSSGGVVYPLSIEPVSNMVMYIYQLQ